MEGRRQKDDPSNLSCLDTSPDLRSRCKFSGSPSSFQTSDPLPSSLCPLPSYEYHFLLKGNRIVESCYAKYWQNLAEEKDLPEFIVGQTLELESVRLSQHKTEANKRFTEPSLVKTLEKNGIGRPSTYATIINTLIDRAYVTLIERGQKAEGRRQKDYKLRDSNSPLIVDDQIKDFNRDLVSKSMKRDNAVLEETPMSDCRNKGEEKSNPLPSALCPLPSKALA